MRGAGSEEGDVVNEATEFWRDYKEAQRKRWDKREQKFIGNLTQFEAAIRRPGAPLPGRAERFARLIESALANGGQG